MPDRQTFLQTPMVLQPKWSDSKCSPLPMRDVRPRPHPTRNTRPQASRFGFLPWRLLPADTHRAEECRGIAALEMELPSHQVRAGSLCRAQLHPTWYLQRKPHTADMCFFKKILLPPPRDFPLTMQQLQGFPQISPPLVPAMKPCSVGVMSGTPLCPKHTEQRSHSGCLSPDPTPFWGGKAMLTRNYPFSTAASLTIRAEH